MLFVFWEDHSGSSKEGQLGSRQERGKGLTEVSGERPDKVFESMACVTEGVH